ncbi:uncharacterized protein LOC116003933 [Ipomoea triloba]|uniref:uncharacterized protein LOC116003933 n=1 Tax=Ipomoea triloba TaxID=35885 RepID=UPI00125DB830|nr:uncharacterized protein LOC116003933 [Ipomoea triloba]
MGGRVNRSVNTGSGPPTFRLSGQNYHLIGSQLPQHGERPHFSQLYIYDTENEISNRIHAVRPDGGENHIHTEIVADIQHDLDIYNVLVKSFRMARDELDNNPRVEVKIKLLGKRNKDARTYNLPTVSEVAALIVGDLDPSMGERDILVESHGGGLKRINELNPAYLPLQYPLLFPYGEDGYRDDIPFNSSRGNGNRCRQRITPREYFAFRLHEHLMETSTLLYSRRLLQQFIVDGYTMVECGRLKYIRTHQKSLRCETYNCLTDALTHGEVNPAAQGCRVILPSSFTGGARYMIQNYQDAMAICRWIGYPNLFITFTCNPKWPEIERYLNRNNLAAQDRADILSRVFKIKLDDLLNDCKKYKLFGNVRSVLYTIEFQKRGLPHAHILLFLDQDATAGELHDLDAIISTEIPNPQLDPDYYKAVAEYMIHGPCGVARSNSPCMVARKCLKFFPKKFVDKSSFDEEGYPVYRRRDNGATVKKSGIELDNRYVVPHNRYLLLKYRAHINVEWCNQSRSIKYLFKYVNKGHDRVTAEFYKANVDDDGVKVVDEINMYYDCRYISPCEAAWRIFGFEIQHKNPSVERLSFHLPGQQTVVFGDDDAIEDLINRPTVAQSMFLEWFECNKKYSDARCLTYVEMPNKFVWKKDVRQWHPRKKGFAIGRVSYVPPGTGEIYYLRCLLNTIRGATCFEDLRNVHGQQYESYKEACYALGLLDNDQEYVDAVNEASQWASAHALRKLFVTLLTSNSISKPETVWEAVWHHLADDAQYNIRKVTNNPGLIVNEADKKNYALTEIEELLSIWGRRLQDFPNMPIPNNSDTQMTSNRLIYKELSYDCNAQRVENEELVRQLTDEQRNIYNTILGDVEAKAGGLFFVYGYGGTGKTFLWKALSSCLRSRGEIVLNVASSGYSIVIASRRTYSTLKICHSNQHK